MNITLLCAIAQVSRSGYYKWLKTKDEPEKDHEDYLLVAKIFKKGRFKLGFRSIKMKLASDERTVMNHKKIIRIMKKYGLRTKIRRVNPYRAIMKKTLEHTTFPNILEREFKQEIPYSVFCTDITYLPFNHRMAYLSVVKDIASNEVVGWYLSMHLEMDIVMNTLEHMQDYCKTNISSFQDILIHSDQGFHYTNPLYANKIKELNMIQSMSRKGNCIDNSPIESFFGHMKDDIDFKACKTFNELHELINEYMMYYNNERCQWDLKKMAPAQYRNHLLSAAV